MRIPFLSRLMEIKEEQLALEIAIFTRLGEIQKFLIKKGSYSVKRKI